MSFTHNLVAYVAAVLAFAPLPAMATTFVMAETPDLFAASADVVIGRIESIRSRAEGAGLRTHVVLAVDEAINGALGATVTVVEPGGMVGDRRQWRFDSPTFFVGERVVLFVRENRRHELEATFGGMGKFRVVASHDGNQFAVRNLGTARALVRRDQRLEPGPTVTSQSLTELVSSLRELAAAAPRRRRSLPVITPATGDQENFTFSGPPQLRWFLPDNNPTVTYRVDSRGDATLGPDASRGAVEEALAAWSTTGCARLQLVAGDAAELLPFGDCDGRNQVTFDDPAGEIADPVHCSGLLAVGGVCANSSFPQTFDGVEFYQITEGDVVVNNGFGGCPFWTPTNLAEVLTHEIGHTIGLGHSSENPDESDPALRDATMYYTAHFDGRGAQLRGDDVDGVCALYPDGETGSVALRRFALVFGSSTNGVAGDGLIVEGTSRLGRGTHFDPRVDTLVLNLQAAGTPLFRLTTAPGQWRANQSLTRCVYRAVADHARTTVMLWQSDPTTLHFRVRARGLDLGAAQKDLVLMSLAIGDGMLTHTVPALRSEVNRRVFP